MTMRRSDQPQSRTLKVGHSVKLHGVRIDCVRIDGETCRIRIWREREISDEAATAVDIPAESATK